MAKKRPGVPYARGRKFCIFCGTPANSEEHIWPKWAKDILPSGGHYKNEVFHGLPSRVPHSIRNYTREGATSTVRIKRVCEGCNNGWMGTYEEEVRPIIEPLIRGQAASLATHEKRKLTEYLTYKLMVLDWFDDQPVMPPDYAHQFYRSRAMPLGFRLWILNCAGTEWQSGFYTQAIGIEELDKWRPSLPPNTKSFAVGFGDLFVFALFSTKAQINIHFNEASSFRLWPLEDRLLVWPFRRITSDRDAEFIAGTLDRLADVPGAVIRGNSP